MRLLLDALPSAEALLADRLYDADWFHNLLIYLDIQPSIRSRKGRKIVASHDADFYRKRHKIENTFARLKDVRKVATYYDRVANIFIWAVNWLR